MEVTRQLRLDQLSKNGLAQIQLTCWWDNQRIRFSSGQRCLPADWDAKRERVKPRDGTNADLVNPILDRYADAAEQVHLAAERAGLDRAFYVGSAWPRATSRATWCLPAIAALAGLTRRALTTKIGRKTFATFKIYQGIPKPQVMLATGHKTEASFNHYPGIDEQELLRNFRKTARKVVDTSGGLTPNVA